MSWLCSVAGGGRAAIKIWLWTMVFAVGQQAAMGESGVIRFTAANGFRVVWVGHEAAGWGEAAIISPEGEMCEIASGRDHLDGVYLTLDGALTMRFLPVSAGSRQTIHDDYGPARVEVRYAGEEAEVEVSGASGPGSSRQKRVHRLLDQAALELHSPAFYEAALAALGEAAASGFGSQPEKVSPEGRGAEPASLACATSLLSWLDASSPPDSICGDPETCLRVRKDRWTVGLVLATHCAL